MTETTDPQAEPTDPFCGSSFAPAPHPTHRYMRGRKAYTCPGETETAASPAPAARAALLRAADLVAERADDLWAPGTKANTEMHADAAELRRMADEAQQPETQPRRGDGFEAWLKAQRDAAADYPEAHQAADGLLDLYRLHADTGTPLCEHVCEGRVAGDCECLETAAGAQQPETQAADRAAIIDEILPTWEAVYEPGNVSDYLIGYANSEVATKGAAEAWMRSQAEVTGRLEWVPEERLATGEYDQWFELIERHDDGIDTGPGLIVRRRVADEARATAGEHR